ncbi:cupin domain-containing protein [Streptomyces kaempferi]
MSDKDSAHDHGHGGHGHGNGEDGPSWTRAAKMLQDASPITVPEGASAMTIHVEWEPGDPGTPPHRHSGPAFGYVVEGAVRFELEGEPERVIEAAVRSGSPAATPSTTRTATRWPTPAPASW